MSLQVGTKLRTSLSPVEVIVVKGTTDDGSLQSAGADMVSEAVTVGSDAPEGPAVALGKRYVDETSGIEVLCTKAGVGPLSFGGRELALKSAKSLPASD